MNFFILGAGVLLAMLSVSMYNEVKRKNCSSKMFSFCGGALAIITILAAMFNLDVISYVTIGVSIINIMIFGTNVQTTRKKLKLKAKLHHKTTHRK